jgi:chemotaxis receptor (MCP) glutamine deamidase CheD
MDKKFLLPGERAFAVEPCTLDTVLGSCIAVVLYHPILKAGGMNHYMLPEAAQGLLEKGKYGDYAIKALVRDAMIQRVNIKELQARIYGGASIVTSVNINSALNAAFEVGKRNIEMAEHMLERLDIPIVARDVGGVYGRRISFDTPTGKVDVKSIIPADDQLKKLKHLQDLASRPLNVLIVDDSATVRKIVRRLLEHTTRFSVCGEAADPYEAREKIMELVPDVILLDVIMPKMNGLEFLKRIMHYKPIPTVILSTLPREGNDMYLKLMSAGAVGVLNKDDLQIYKSPKMLEEKLLPLLESAAKMDLNK